MSDIMERLEQIALLLLDFEGLLFVSILVIMWGAEALTPLRRGRAGVVAYTFRNLFLYVAATLLLLPFAGAIGIAGRYLNSNEIGFLYWLDLPVPLMILIAILCADLGNYLFHIALHKVPVLWRFHRVHHSDPVVSASTVFRIHPGEVLLHSVNYILCMAIFGIPMIGLALWLLISAFNEVIQHAHVRVNARVDETLSLVIASPYVHRLHHSRHVAETDSNYASLFSFWDRLFGTFVYHEDHRPVSVGLNEYDHERWQEARGLLLTPLDCTQVRRYLFDEGRSRAGSPLEIESSASSGVSG